TSAPTITEPWQFFVRSLDTTVTVTGAPDTLVAVVMGYLQQRLGIPAAEQRLTYMGAELAAAQPLSMYNVQRNSTVELTLRLRGSGPSEDVELSPIRPEEVAAQAAELERAREAPNGLQRVVGLYGFEELFASNTQERRLASPKYTQVGSARCLHVAPLHPSHHTPPQDTAPAAGSSSGAAPALPQAWMGWHAGMRGWRLAESSG
ncbi:hypothetical protein EBR96_10710, partial [bacterium]|nr:hypothetical protein [bacterium]